MDQAHMQDSLYLCMTTIRSLSQHLVTMFSSLDDQQNDDHRAILNDSSCSSICTCTRKCICLQKSDRQDCGSTILSDTSSSLDDLKMHVKCCSRIENDYYEIAPYREDNYDSYEDTGRRNVGLNFNKRSPCQIILNNISPSFVTKEAYCNNDEYTQTEAIYLDGDGRQSNLSEGNSLKNDQVSPKLSSSDERRRRTENATQLRENDIKNDTNEVDIQLSKMTNGHLQFMNDTSKNGLHISLRYSQQDVLNDTERNGPASSILKCNFGIQNDMEQQQEESLNKCFGRIPSASGEGLHTDKIESGISKILSKVKEQSETVDNVDSKISNILTKIQQQSETVVNVESGISNILSKVKGQSGTINTSVLLSPSKSNADTNTSLRIDQLDVLGYRQISKKTQSGSTYDVNEMKNNEKHSHSDLSPDVVVVNDQDNAEKLTSILIVELENERRLSSKLTNKLLECLNTYDSKIPSERSDKNVVNALENKLSTLNSTVENNEAFRSKKGSETMELKSNPYSEENRMSDKEKRSVKSKVRYDDEAKVSGKNDENQYSLVYCALDEDFRDSKAFTDKIKDEDEYMAVPVPDDRRSSQILNQDDITSFSKHFDENPDDMFREKNDLSHVDIIVEHDNERDVNISVKNADSGSRVLSKKSSIKSENSLRDSKHIGVSVKLSGGGESKKQSSQLKQNDASHSIKEKDDFASSLYSDRGSKKDPSVKSQTVIPKLSQSYNAGSETLLQPPRKKDGSSKQSEKKISASEKDNKYSEKSSKGDKNAEKSQSKNEVISEINGVGKMSSHKNSKDVSMSQRENKEIWSFQSATSIPKVTLSDRDNNIEEVLLQESAKGSNFDQRDDTIKSKKDSERNSPSKLLSDTKLEVLSKKEKVSESRKSSKDVQVDEEVLQSEVEDDAYLPTEVSINDRNLDDVIDILESEANEGDRQDNNIHTVDPGNDDEKNVAVLITGENISEFEGVHPDKISEKKSSSKGGTSVNRKDMDSEQKRITPISSQISLNTNDDTRLMKEKNRNSEEKDLEFTTCKGSSNDFIAKHESRASLNRSVHKNDDIRSNQSQEQRNIPSVESGRISDEKDIEFLTCKGSSSDFVTRHESQSSENKSTKKQGLESFTVNKDDNQNKISSQQSYTGSRNEFNNDKDERIAKMNSLNQMVDEIGAVEKKINNKLNKYQNLLQNQPIKSGSHVIKKRNDSKFKLSAAVDDDGEDYEDDDDDRSVIDILERNSDNNKVSKTGSNNEGTIVNKINNLVYTKVQNDGNRDFNKKRNDSKFHGLTSGPDDIDDEEMSSHNNDVVNDESGSNKMIGSPRKLSNNLSGSHGSVFERMHSNQIINDQQNISDMSDGSRFRKPVSEKKVTDEPTDKTSKKSESRKLEEDYVKDSDSAAGGTNTDKTVENSILNEDSQHDIQSPNSMGQDELNSLIKSFMNTIHEEAQKDEIVAVHFRENEIEEPSEISAYESEVAEGETRLTSRQIRDINIKFTEEILDILAKDTSEKNGNSIPSSKHSRKCPLSRLDDRLKEKLSLKKQNDESNFLQRENKESHNVSKVRHRKSHSSSSTVTTNSGMIKATEFLTTTDGASGSFFVPINLRPAQSNLILKEGLVESNKERYRQNYSTAFYAVDLLLSTSSSSTTDKALKQLINMDETLINQSPYISDKGDEFLSYSIGDNTTPTIKIDSDSKSNLFAFPNQQYNEKKKEDASNDDPFRLKISFGKIPTKALRQEYNEVVSISKCKAIKTVTTSSIVENNDISNTSVNNQMFSNDNRSENKHTKSMSSSIQMNKLVAMVSPTLEYFHQNKNLRKYDNDEYCMDVSIELSEPPNLDSKTDITYSNRSLNPTSLVLEASPLPKIRFYPPSMEHDAIPDRTNDRIIQNSQMSCFAFI